jgi:mevalonate kinase
MIVMHTNFQTKVHAKWILTGEHAVLRGHPALVFPIPSKYIELFYWQDPEPLRVEFTASPEDNFLMLFWTVLEEALKLLHKKLHDVQGRLLFRNNIPMGAGMGFSAAFCISLARWLQWNQWLKEAEVFEFARQLENIFHGKSSGVDIAGVMLDGGVYYKIPGKMRTLQLNWRPHLYLSHCGQISVTSKCVNLVEELWESNAAMAGEIDQQMLQSVQLAEQALISDEKSGLILLANAIQIANQCFLQWELLNEPLLRHSQRLQQAGALAYKPTGAGDGGYVLSLWDKVPELPFEMIAVF